MLTFPALEPHRRNWELGEFALTEEPAWATVSVRFRHGRTAGVANTNAPLTISYVDLYEDEVQQIRDHYIAQQGGTMRFPLPAIIWRGLDDPPITSQFRYAVPPRENQRSGGLFDLVVNLISAD